MKRISLGKNQLLTSISQKPTVNISFYHQLNFFNSILSLFLISFEGNKLYPTTSSGGRGGFVGLHIYYIFILLLLSNPKHVFNIPLVVVVYFELRQSDILNNGVLSTKAVNLLAVASV